MNRKQEMEDEMMAKLTLKEGKNGTIIDDEDKMNFGTVAEERILAYRKNVRENREITYITRSKIHGILALVNKIYNRVIFNPNDVLEPDQVSDIAYLEVKIAYEMGRDPEKKNGKEIAVKEFLEETYLKNPIKDIVESKKKEDFLLYAKYVESLVAYFKFHKGRD